MKPKQCKLERNEYVMIRRDEEFEKDVGENCKDEP